MKMSNTVGIITNFFSESKRTIFLIKRIHSPLSRMWLPFVVIFFLVLSTSNTSLLRNSLGELKILNEKLEKEFIDGNDEIDNDYNDDDNYQTTSIQSIKLPIIELLAPKLNDKEIPQILELGVSTDNKSGRQNKGGIVNVFVLKKNCSEDRVGSSADNEKRPTQEDQNTDLNHSNEPNMNVEISTDSQYYKILQTILDSIKNLKNRITGLEYELSKFNEKPANNQNAIFDIPLYHIKLEVEPNLNESDIIKVFNSSKTQNEIFGCHQRRLFRKSLSEHQTILEKDENTEYSHPLTSSSLIEDVKYKEGDTIPLLNQAMRNGSSNAIYNISRIQTRSVSPTNRKFHSGRRCIFHLKKKSTTTSLPPASTTSPTSENVKFKEDNGIQLQNRTDLEPSDCNSNKRTNWNAVIDLPLYSIKVVVNPKLVSISKNEDSISDESISNKPLKKSNKHIEVKFLSPIPVAPDPIYTRKPQHTKIKYTTNNMLFQLPYILNV